MYINSRLLHTHVAYIAPKICLPKKAMTLRNQHQRLWEIDAFRGFAIVTMLYYHLAFDLYYFGQIDVDWDGLVWNMQAKCIKSIFLFIVGIALWLHFCYAKQNNTPRSIMIYTQVKRGLFIFSLGMLITIATTYTLSSGAIHFGILHAIGAAIIVLSPFVHLKARLLIPAICIISAAWILQGKTINNHWFLWLGIMAKDYSTVDYAPLIPNLGIVMLGITVGSWLYPHAIRTYTLANQPPHIIWRWLCFLGNHSLVIYLVHQIVLFGVFYALELLGILTVNIQAA